MFELKKYTSTKALNKLSENKVFASMDINITEYVEQIYSLGQLIPITYRCLNPSVTISITHNNGDVEEIRGVMKNNTIKIINVYINNLKMK